MAPSWVNPTVKIATRGCKLLDRLADAVHTLCYKLGENCNMVAGEGVYVMFRARATLLLFCLAFTGTAVLSQPKVQPKGKNASAPPAQTDPIVLGRTYLNLGDLEKARAYCESALPNQPVEAQKCLAELVQAQYEAKLRDFETSVDLGKREDAIKAALLRPTAHWGNARCGLLRPSWPRRC